MNMIPTSFRSDSHRFHLVRWFGRAALVLQASGSWKLVGGRNQDRQEAREWISLFCHEALVDTAALGAEEPLDEPKRAVRPISLV